MAVSFSCGAMATLLSALPSAHAPHPSSTNFVPCSARPTILPASASSAVSRAFASEAESSEVSATRVAVDPSSPLSSVQWGAGGRCYNTQILVGESEATESVVRRFKKVRQAQRQQNTSGRDMQVSLSSLFLLCTSPVPLVVSALSQVCLEANIVNECRRRRFFRPPRTSRSASRRTRRACASASRESHWHHSQWHAHSSSVDSTPQCC